MLKGISKGLSVASEKMIELDETAKKADLIRTIKKIDELEKKIEVLRAKEAVLMDELNIQQVVWNEEGIELA